MIDKNLRLIANLKARVSTLKEKNRVLRVVVDQKKESRAAYDAESLKSENKRLNSMVDALKAKLRGQEEMKLTIDSLTAENGRWKRELQRIKSK